MKPRALQHITSGPVSRMLVCPLADTSARKDGHITQTEEPNQLTSWIGCCFTGSPQWLSEDNLLAVS
eukprot:12712189-Prorocentrum_lima.AAC.1